MWAADGGPRCHTARLLGRSVLFFPAFQFCGNLQAALSPAQQVPQHALPVLCPSPASPIKAECGRRLAVSIYQMHHLLLLATALEMSCLGGATARLGHWPDVQRYMYRMYIELRRQSAIGRAVGWRNTGDEADSARNCPSRSRAGGCALSARAR